MLNYKLFAGRTDKINQALAKLTQIQTDLTPKIVTKTITFNGTSGRGAVGTSTLFTVEGSVMAFVCAVCGTDLTGNNATIEVGVSGDTAGLLPQITATDLDAGEWWASTPATLVSAPSYKLVTGNIVLKVGTANVTGGSVTFACVYYPIAGTVSA